MRNYCKNSTKNPTEECLHKDIDFCSNCPIYTGYNSRAEEKARTTEPDPAIIPPACDEPDHTYPPEWIDGVDTDQETIERLREERDRLWEDLKYKSAEVTDLKSEIERIRPQDTFIKSHAGIHHIDSFFEKVALPMVEKERDELCRLLKKSDIKIDALEKAIEAMAYRIKKLEARDV